MTTSKSGTRRPAPPSRFLFGQPESAHGNFGSASPVALRPHGDRRRWPVHAPRNRSGRIVQLLVEGPGIESAKFFARTEPGEKIELLRDHRQPDLGKYLYYPAQFVHVVGPSQAIVGVVRDGKSKTPLAGVTVKSQSRHGVAINGAGEDFVRAVTDAEGRYRLEGMPIGSGNRIAAIAPPGKTAYLSTSRQAATGNQEKPLEIDFDLPAGVWIEGQITDRTTGRGLEGELHCFVTTESPAYPIVASLNVDERD